MGQRAKYFCRGLALFMGLWLYVTWDSPGSHRSPWPLRIVLLAGLAMTILPLIWARFRTDKAPDFLRQYDPKYMEQDGLCFSIEPVVSDGTCYLHVRFQNRYSKRSEALIVLTCGLTPMAAIPITCEGGGFGNAWVPFGVPEDAQGRSLRTELYAGVRYPEGRGSLLRFRGGIGTRRLRRSGRAVDINGKLVRYAKLDGREGFGADLTLKLPRGVPASIPAGWPVSWETQWHPGEGAELVEPESQPTAQCLLFENVALTAAWWLAGNRVTVEDESVGRLLAMEPQILPQNSTSDNGSEA